MTAVLTCVQPGVLLHVAELLEAPVAVGALVGLLAGVYPDVLHQLVVGRERLEALLTLVRLHLTPVHLAGVQLHRRLVHEDLQQPQITVSSITLVAMKHIVQL